MIFGLLAGAFFACGEEEKTATEEVVTTCATTIKETNPGSGAADFYILDDIVVEFADEEDATATVTLLDASGAEVAGSTSVDGYDVTFSPDAALMPSSNYTISISYCNDGGTPVEIGFTTSGLGEALSGSVAGKTYAVNIASGTFVKPAGVGDLIGGAFNNNILIGILDDSNGELQVEGAISLEGSLEQDVCTETLVFPEAADFSDAPYFEIPEGDLTLSIAGITATIYDLNISGMFAADGSYFGGGELRGNLDARDLVDVIAELVEVESADDICGLVAGFGVACEPCADGANYCLGVEVVDLVADVVDGTTLVSVTSQDIADNPDCAQ
jgi:hypothetical protein